MSTVSPSASVCVLAVGTELTTGQITNRNAAWISVRAEALGAHVVLHETVPDDRVLIRAALDRCADQGSQIFVTGGLGPTTDDFTREVVAEWLGKRLDFDAPSWERIRTRLGDLGIPVAESNRQQCYFPEGAQIIQNPEGTASAFFCTLKRGDRDVGVWVLPGPPREVEAVWKARCEALLRERLPAVERKRLLTWQCIGKSEAELGEITERAMQGSGLQTGYRAHRPFVEVKIWVPEAKLSESEAALSALDAALAPWTVTRQGEDLAARLLDRLRRADEIEIIDAATGGLLAARLGPALAAAAATGSGAPGGQGALGAEPGAGLRLLTEWAPLVAPAEWVEHVLADADEGVLTLALGGFSESGGWAIGLREGSSLRSETLQSPWRGAKLLDRSRAMATELALLRWAGWLDESTH